MAKSVWKNIIIIAPVTKSMALSLPSFMLTFAAVILINPGNEIPMQADKKPDKKEKAKFNFLEFENYFYFILKRIYVIALLISKYCFS